MAVGPDRVGFGSVTGRPTVRDVPLSRYVANGPEPPPENTMSVTVATGATDPSGRCFNVVSTGVHEPSGRWTCVGTADAVNVEDPSGFANTCTDSVRPDITSTRCPHRFAMAEALASSAPVA